jgi:uncharacterized protein (TIGR00369 family)
MILFMGIRATGHDATADRLTCVMPFRRELSNEPDAPFFHGGAIMALIDTVATFALLAKGLETVPTVNARVDFLRPATNTGLTATASVRRVGRTSAIVDVDVVNDEHKLVAIGRCGFAVLT